MVPVVLKDQSVQFLFSPAAVFILFYFFTSSCNEQLVSYELGDDHVYPRLCDSESVDMYMIYVHVSIYCFSATELHPINNIRYLYKCLNFFPAVNITLELLEYIQ